MFDFELERGYTLCPRVIDKLPEGLCKLYKHLLAKATYKPRGELETGQVATTIWQLRKHHGSMNYSRYKMETAIGELEELGLIAWQRGRPGVPSIITLLNYDLLQKPKSYGKRNLAPNQPRTSTY